jgi:tripartite-type tricarboxylate transporter receptor subunit TctC
MERQAWRIGAARAVVTAISLILSLSMARAQSVANFYRSHALTLGVPNEAGGGYDIYMRLLARHLADHIPGNPAIVVQNVPAAGGLALANTLYSSAPKDGSYIGLVRGTVVQEQIYGDPHVKFDARKFGWLGDMNSDHDTCIVWAASGVRSLADFYTRQIVLAASGAGAQSYAFPVAYRELLGMKLKVIAGYGGTPDRILAMQRGEVTGACGVSTSSLRSALAALLADGKIKVIAQAGVTVDPGFPNVPNLLDQAKTPQTRQALRFLFLPLALGRPLAAPPGAPADRLAALRSGLMATLRDPAFLTDARKVGVDIGATDSVETERLVGDLFATPPAVVRRIEAAIMD